jgi:hypothetical protein
MAWPEDLDEQMRRRWLSRLAQERLDLSASVEAALGETALQADQFPEALGTTPGTVQAPQKKVIIPPRLSLQSRLMPAVNSDSRALSLGVKRSLTNPDAWNADLSVIDAEPVTDEQSANFLSRLAHRITSSLSALLVNNQDESTVVGAPEDVMPSSVTDEPRNGPRVYNSSLALPVVHVPAEPPIMRALPAPRSTEMQTLGQGKQRVPKRPTKVRLEAVSTLGTVTQMEGQSGMGTMFSGSGIVEPGQSEVAVANAEVKSSSIVMVMLAGDPGPVVVQYITLRPLDGFTVHLSAPALAKTPFNYAILAGEPG